MSMAPGAGPFRMLTGAAIAYGLTSGGAQAPEISITPLGMRIVRPTTEGDDLAAKREAVLRPTVVGDFLRQYDGAALRPDAIAKNVLTERGIPADRVDDVLSIIIDGAMAVGFIKDINGKKYVDLAGLPATGAGGNDHQTGVDASAAHTVAVPVAAAAPTPRAVSVAAGLNINIQIHIAADASAETIEEIFKNMRRYVLGGDGTTNVE